MPMHWALSKALMGLQGSHTSGLLFETIAWMQ